MVQVPLAPMGGPAMAMRAPRARPRGGGTSSIAMMRALRSRENEGDKNRKMQILQMLMALLQAGREQEGRLEVARQPGMRAETEWAARERIAGGEAQAQAAQDAAEAKAKIEAATTAHTRAQETATHKEGLTRETTRREKGGPGLQALTAGATRFGELYEKGQGQAQARALQQMKGQQAVTLAERNAELGGQPFAEGSQLEAERIGIDNQIALVMDQIMELGATVAGIDDENDPLRKYLRTLEEQLAGLQRQRQRLIESAGVGGPTPAPPPPAPATIRGPYSPWSPPGRAVAPVAPPAPAPPLAPKQGGAPKPPMGLPPKQAGGKSVAPPAAPARSYPSGAGGVPFQTNITARPTPAPAPVGPPAVPITPGPPAPTGPIHVRLRATGETGFIDAADFDPATMELIQ